jgi:hypothetical protein
MPASSNTATSFDPGSDSGVRVSREAQQHEAPSSPLIESRFATAADIIEYYGAPQRGTMRAFVILLDGKPAGFIGLLREGGIGKYFTEYKPELQPYLKSITIMRALCKALDWCRAYRGPVIAIATTAESCYTMNRLGFEHMEGVYYGWFDKWHS